MKRLRKIALWGLALYMFIIGAMFLLQEKLIFLPTQLPQEYRYSFDQKFEELFVTTNDGARLNALHFKVENPKGIILYFHGNAGDLSRWGSVTSYFEQYEYDVLVMDYRSYGKSTGALSEAALYKDAQLFYDTAKNLFSEEYITIYGRSLGTTFASYVAAHNQPKQLILEAPFFSLKKLAQERYWFLPVNTLLRYQFPTSQLVGDVDCPITIIHGTEDRVVPYHNGVELYKTLPQSQANFLTIEGGSHHDLMSNERYQKMISKLLESSR